MACAAEFVFGTEGGLSAQVGERGSLLSGGERQRLCLVRGFLRDTPVLLLDEPTSSVDRETEAAVLSAIASQEDLTCLVVTHRLDVVEHADLVLVMDSGRLVEAGTHEDLLRTRDCTGPCLPARSACLDRLRLRKGVVPNEEHASFRKQGGRS